MIITRTLSAFVATAALAFAGCSSTEPESPGRAARSDSASAAPSSEAEPTISPGMVPRVDDGKPVKGRKDNTAIAVTGINDRWTVDTRYNIDGALGNELGEKANAFLREHYLRADRWSGKWNIKEGEMDAFRAKVTPAMFTEVNDAVIALNDDYAEQGLDDSKWSKKVMKVARERAATYGSLFLNTTPDDNGKGDLVYRTHGRTVFRGTAANNWEGDLIGAPITYVYVDASHKVGSTGPVTYFVWQGWKKVKGEWTIFAAGRSTA